MKRIDITYDKNKLSFNNLYTDNRIVPTENPYFNIYLHNDIINNRLVVKSPIWPL